MFSVYGISGQIFSGTLEQMNRVPPTTHTGSTDYPITNLHNLTHTTAVRSYRAMLPEELERGPLVHAAQAMSHPATIVRDAASAVEAWHFFPMSRYYVRKGSERR